MALKNGNLSINSENIFPIIKKWMYSDQDIFIRELISNGVDAVTKLKRLSSLGEASLPDYPTRSYLERIFHCITSKKEYDKRMLLPCHIKM